MRVTVPSELFVTQTEPAPGAIAEGAFPTATESTTRPEPGSIFSTTPSGLTIQTEPKAARAGRAVPPKNPTEARSGRAKARRSYLGSIFETRPEPSVTQTPVLVAAIPAGVSPIGTLRTAFCDAPSTRVTLSSSRFATHSAPAPDAIAAGRAPTGTVATIDPDGSRATIEFAATGVAGDSPPLRAATMPAIAVAVAARATATTASRFREATRGAGPSDPRSSSATGAASAGGGSAATAAQPAGASSRPR